MINLPKMRILLLIIISLSALCQWPAAVCSQQQVNADFRVSFNLDRDADNLVIKPVCLNKTKTEAILRYKLEVKRLIKGKFDKKTAIQSGIFAVLPGEEKIVCRMEVRIHPSSTVVVKRNVDSLINSLSCDDGRFCACAYVFNGSFGCPGFV